MTSQPSTAARTAPSAPSEPAASARSKVLSVRIDSDLFDRLAQHAAKRGMSVQDYVTRTLVRDDFDERFKAAVEETERFYSAN